MDLDQYRPGYILYTDNSSLMTSDGKTTHLIAGTRGQYREGVGAEARFFSISGFTQLSGKRDIVADHDNHCLRQTLHQSSVDSVSLKDIRMVDQVSSTIPGLLQQIRGMSISFLSLTPTKEL